MAAVTVALIAESGIRLMDVDALRDEIRLPVGSGRRLRKVYTNASTMTFDMPSERLYRRFVRMDDHTYVEKD